METDGLNEVIKQLTSPSVIEQMLRAKPSASEQLIKSDKEIKKLEDNQNHNGLQIISSGFPLGED